MPEIIFEVKRLLPVLCSYPGCERINGTVRRATWMIRELGSGKEPQPVCYICKAWLKAMLGARERAIGKEQG